MLVRRAKRECWLGAARFGALCAFGLGCRWTSADFSQASGQIATRGLGARQAESLAVCVRGLGVSAQSAQEVCASGVQKVVVAQLIGRLKPGDEREAILRAGRHPGGDGVVELDQSIRCDLEQPLVQGSDPGPVGRAGA